MTALLVAGAVLAAVWAVVRARAMSAQGRGGWARLGGLRLPEVLVARLTPGDAELAFARAGIRADPRAVGCARLLGAGCGGLVGASCALLVPLAVVMAVPGALLGAIAPTLALRRAQRTRARALRAELPPALDLLAICVQGGMAVDPALSALTRHSQGALADEVAEVLRSIELGLQRRTAYGRLAERCPCDEVATLVTALHQSEELGAPLAPILRAHAQRVREAARREALERAASAAPRIQLVTALVLVPAAMLLIVATLLLQLGQQIGAAVGGTT